MHKPRWLGRGVRAIGLIGNHLPRHCGIATFTTDLADALASQLDGVECLVLAMNEPGRRYDYPGRVALEIAEEQAASYRCAAQFLNDSGVDVVSLQHEYGIFGGPAGALLLELVRELRVPLVTTLHTILAHPSAAQRAVMDQLARQSDRFVVMSSTGASLLRSVHGVDARNIDVIPHGIPEVRSDPGGKAALGLDGREIILTFGLLSPDKGIEYVIDALPEIVAQRPRATYVVLGVTHPHVREHHGEEYREMLQARAARLGVESSVVFHDRFVSHDELVRFLQAADLYVTPYLNTEQITSGTLAYAVGAGKAVLSTPYRYATELLKDGCGVLVPPRDSRAIAREVLGVLNDAGRRHGLEQRAAAHGRTMTWPVVARGYLDSFDRALLGAATRRDLAPASPSRPLPREVPAARPRLPDLDLGHLRIMTDDTGLLQHAAFSVPRCVDGYCLDDNARALLLAMKLEGAPVLPARAVRALATRYLAFVNHAFDADRGRFRNFMTYARQWVDAPSPDDCHGRAVWALGSVIGRCAHRGMVELARHLWREALPATTSLASPRAWAYTLLGVDERLRARGARAGARLDPPGLPLLVEPGGVVPTLVERLLARFRATATAEWPWFEDRLTYCNARLAEGLLVGGAHLQNAEALETGLRALRWLCSVQTVDGLFAPIGSDGFWVRGGPRAAFDQQPVEAAATVSACLEALRLTRDASWLREAYRAFGWFLGQNQAGLSLRDPVSGGCHDGLHDGRVNENQGAESTLSFLLALSDMRASERATRETGRPGPRVVALPLAAGSVIS